MIANIIALVLSSGSLLIAWAAYRRAHRENLEDQRDRLLAQITDLAVDVWRRDSELVALLHANANGACEASPQINFVTEMFRKTLRQQLAALEARFSAVVQARGRETRKVLVTQRIEMFRATPLMAAQMQDIADHLTTSTNRMQRSPQSI